MATSSASPGERPPWNPPLASGPVPPSPGRGRADPGGEAGVTAPPPPAYGVPVSRWSRAATITTATAAVALAVLAAAPYLVGVGVTQPLVTLFLLVSIAVLWNLLAGYAGMLSFGQQAYLGIGAYTVYLVSKGGMSPFAAIAAAAGSSCTARLSSPNLLRTSRYTPATHTVITTRAAQ